jgi:hypothetical protein
MQIGGIKPHRIFLCIAEQHIFAENRAISEARYGGALQCQLS